MAGDWIKIETCLPDKPEVMRLSHLLDIDEMQVVGHLVKFWSWCDQNMSLDCPVVSGTKRGLDRVAMRDGFVDAMVTVGWLKVAEDGSITIPNYENHLSKSAKQRAQDSKKKQKQREKEKKQLSSMSLKCPDTTGTNEGQNEGLEKRREEKSNKRKVIKEKSVRDNPPTVEEVRDYMLNRGKPDCAEEFHAYYSANGWVQGKSAKLLVDWKAAVTNWFVQKKKYEREPLFEKIEDDDPCNKSHMAEFLAYQAELEERRKRGDV